MLKMKNKLTKETKKIILKAQKNEITEYNIYKKLAKREKDSENKKILLGIAKEELKHYNIWKSYTKVDVKPSRLKILKYRFISKIFGLTFAIKLMERGEEDAQVTYSKISNEVPEAKKIVQEEDNHEQKLVKLIDEERLRYVDSMVLGLNDGLVEITGALAGFTLALGDNKIIAMVGLITGISGALSMAASEYLSTKSEDVSKSPIKASTYTGSAYILTVLLLVMPYFLFSNLFLALGVTISNAVLVIFLFNYYISVAKDISFKKRFTEMAGISLGIAALSFVIGYFIKASLNVDV